MKIAPRVTIRPSFMEAVRTLHLNYITAIDNVSKGDAERRKYFLDKNPEASMRAIDCLRNTQGPRRGTNYDIVTRFQTDPRYEVLWGEEVNGVLWLMGKTKPIFLKGNDANFGIGPYIVAYCVPNMAEGGNTHHFIPALSPLENFRHPHHTAVYAGDGLPKSPFEFIPNTCFGGFDTVIASMIAARDVAGLYQTTHKYLSIYNGGSPLKNVRYIEWMQKLKR